MLKSSGLPKNFWAEAIVIAAYLSNISTTYAFWEKTPHKLWFGVKPKVTYLNVFGCVALVHIPVQRLQKLDDRAVKGIFIACCVDENANRVYLADSEKVLISRDVKFVESEIWKWIVMNDQASKVIVLQERKADSIEENHLVEEVSGSCSGASSSKGNGSSMD